MRQGKQLRTVMAQLIELAQDVKRVEKENERLSKEVVKLKQNQRDRSSGRKNGKK